MQAFSAKRWLRNQPSLTIFWHCFFTKHLYSTKQNLAVYQLLSKINFPEQYNNKSVKDSFILVTGPIVAWPL